MVGPNLILDLHYELFIDNFAGGGGASTGIEWAIGRYVDHAINHCLKALGMHRINHPQTIHHETDVFDIDPMIVAVVNGIIRRIGAAWFSPDCKHFSKAKGAKPVSKKIRGLVLVMLRWAKARARRMFMENVEEIQTWGPLLPNGRPDPAHKGRTWQAFLDCLGPGIDQNHPDLPEILEVLENSVTREELLAGFRYHYECREIRACDYGAHTIRKRLYMIACCDGMPIIWPDYTHGAPDSPEVKSRQRKPYNIIAECIEWSIPCRSIFLNRREARRLRCKRPLVKSSCRRIAKGTDKYVMRARKPFLFSLTHHGADRIQSIDEPIRTITGAHRGEKGLVDATLAPFIYEHANGSRDRAMAANQPLRTQCAEVKGGHFALAAASLVKLRGNPETHQVPGQPVTDGINTISAGGQHHVLLSACLAAYYGAEEDGQPIDEALRTISTKARFGLNMAEAVALPLSTGQLIGAHRVAKFLRKYGVEFEGEFATVGGFVIVDLAMRMLTPRELFRAQGFPDSYIIDKAWIVDKQTGDLVQVHLTKEQQIRMCGNSVCPAVARALVAANCPDMIVWGKGERERHDKNMLAFSS